MAEAEWVTVGAVWRSLLGAQGSGFSSRLQETTWGTGISLVGPALGHLETLGSVLQLVCCADEVSAPACRGANGSSTQRPHSLSLEQLMAL